MSIIEGILFIVAGLATGNPLAVIAGIYLLYVGVDELQAKASGGPRAMDLLFGEMNLNEDDSELATDIFYGVTTTLVSFAGLVQPRLLQWHLRWLGYNQVNTQEL